MANKYYVVFVQDGKKFYKKKGAGWRWYSENNKDMAYQYTYVTAIKTAAKLMLENTSAEFGIEKV